MSQQLLQSCTSSRSTEHDSFQPWVPPGAFAPNIDAKMLRKSAKKALENENHVKIQVNTNTAMRLYRLSVAQGPISLEYCI